DLHWGLEGDLFTMWWAERDGPPVSLPRRRGFGSTVMTSLVERSVCGNVQLDYAPAGLRWRLTCHAADAVEAAEKKTRGAEDRPAP
ncbi:MAG: hypothetical protein J2P53_16730, partial [Bradyrhizobiaceae bacterium]|nr:hypothetical protein [Bradyrhizobiaceae bacterium]